jgi:hypothetical protein
MRFLLAFLAVLAMATSPATTAVARAACDQTAPMAMAGTDVPGIDPSIAAQTADPCCDHGGAHKHKTDSCSQTCAVACAVAVALPASSVSITRGAERATVIPAQLTLARAHEPSGPDRPPKSMA